MALDVTNILAWVCLIAIWGVCLCCALIYKLTKLYRNDTSWRFVCLRAYASCMLKCKHMTLAINMLNNVVPLCYKTQTIMSSIPMCYDRCHDEDIFSPQSANNIILTINIRDTLGPMGIWFILNTINDMHVLELLCLHYIRMFAYLTSFQQQDHICIAYLRSTFSS